MGFHAQHLLGESSNLVYPSPGSPLIFSLVHFNSGNAYSSATGYFTAPYPGVYLFLATTNGYTAAHYIYVDSTEVNHGFVTHNALDRNAVSYSTATLQAVVHLRVGQRVWINSGRESGTYYYSSVSSFSGVLLSRDV